MSNSLTHLFFPKICYACGYPLGDSFDHICLRCRHELPQTKAHLMEENPIEKIFWGRLPLQNATSFLRFEKRSKVQHLIHFLKYKGIKEIGISLGKWAAEELSKDKFFKGIDGIVPVPIHKKKKQKRGFNQSEYIANGIGEITEIPVDTNLIHKEINTSSQTRKARFRRWQNVKTTFKLNLKVADSFHNKHILLVDDVLTTGATVEACGKELLKIPSLKLSLLTMAYTY